MRLLKEGRHLKGRVHDALEGLPNLFSEMSAPKYGGIQI